jgi:hypothetical protein
MGIRSNVKAGTFVTSPLGFRAERAILDMEAIRTRLPLRY